MNTFINVIRALFIKFTPTGNITATNVQDAVAEIDTRLTNIDSNNVKTTGDQTVDGIKTFTGVTIFSDATEATLSTLGSALFNGGISVYKSIWVGDSTSNHSFSGSVNFPTSSATHTFSGKVSIINATSSTSTTTGALTVSGGVGIVGNCYISSNLNAGTIVGNASISSSGSISSSTIIISPVVSSPLIKSSDINAVLNTSGTDLTLRPGTGTGTAAPNNILFQTANSGVSGTTSQTVSEKMRLSGLGNLLLNTTTDDGVNKLQVAGSASFTGDITANSISLATTNTTANTANTTANNSVQLTGNQTVAGIKTFTSNLVADADLTVGINTRAAATTLAIRSATGQLRDITFRSGNTDRWNLRVNAVAESGSNAGSNFQIVARDDAGALIDSPLSINRVAGGAITITRPTTFSDTTASTSSTSGAVTIAGGLGVVGNINTGGNLAAVGQVSANTFLVAPIVRAGDVNGTDVTATNLTIRPGTSTGAATPANLIFQTSNSGTTGTTAQTNTEKMRLVGSTGNLLIGTTTDNTTDKLQVNGSVSIAGNTLTLPISDSNGIRIGNGSTTGFRLSCDNSRQATITLLDTGASAFRVLTSSLATAFFVSNSNRTLIGTNTDNGTETLQVNGGISSSYLSINSAVTTYNPPVRLNIAAYGHPTLELRDPANPSSNPGLRFVNSAIRNAEIGFSSGSSTGITFKNFSTGGLALGVAGTLGVTDTTASTSTTTGCATFAGGVGVAGDIYCINLRPTTNVIVGSGGTVFSNIFSGNNASGTDIASSNFTFNAAKSTGSANPASIIFTTSNAGTSGTTVQSSTEKMRLSGLGNLLIGTTTDNTTDKLQVSGSIFVTGSSVFSSTLQSPTFLSPASGINPPATTTRSTGTKIVLYPAINASNVDFALGVATNALWLSVPTNTSTHKISFYGGTTEVANLSGTGVLNLLNTTAATSTSTGCLTTGGGVGVAGAGYFGGIVNAPQLTTTKQTLTPTGTTQSINWNSGSYIELNVSSATGNVTLTLSNPNIATYLIELVQGATARNIIFPSGTLQGGGGGNTYTGVANRRDVIAVTWNGSNYLINSVQGYA